tara:strand:+ start:8887 stop:9123 length:237 start_codon:yes stop_codon:yes gene_type:complete
MEMLTEKELLQLLDERARMVKQIEQLLAIEKRQANTIIEQQNRIYKLRDRWERQYKSYTEEYNRNPLNGTKIPEPWNY